jgi:hypothetical protein
MRIHVVDKLAFWPVRGAQEHRTRPEERLYVPRHRPEGSPNDRGGAALAPKIRENWQHRKSISVNVFVPLGFCAFCERLQLVDCLLFSFCRGEH